VHRGEVWWVSLPGARRLRAGGSSARARCAGQRVQCESFHTVIVAVITSNLRLAAAPGNVLCQTREIGFPRDSVVNVSQLITVDKSLLTERVGLLPARTLRQVEAGLRLVLSL